MSQLSVSVYGTFWLPNKISLNENSACSKIVFVAKHSVWRNILRGEIFCVAKYSVWRNILRGEIFYVAKYFMWQNILRGEIFYVAKYSGWRNIPYCLFQGREFALSLLAF